MPKEMDYDSTMNSQMDDLRERMKLLQGDRKANIDLLESTKQANKELIRQLRDENKEFRKQLSVLQRTESSTRGRSDDEEIDILTKQLGRIRKQYDDVLHTTKSQTNTLEQLKDEVKDLDLESFRPNLEDTPETRKIRRLENNLDKAMIKFNEAQSIRKTYEQIVKRLQEERVGFDNQLAAIERALEAKNHDYEELLLLSGDAQHAKEVALHELEKTRSSYEEERMHRDKEYREREQILKIKIEMNTKLEDRERQKKDILSKESGDLNEEEEEALKTSLVLKNLHRGQVIEEKKEHRSKIDIFENAFRKIKEATGVSDVNEVIEKIISQQGTTDNLMMLTKENQTRIENLSLEKKRLKDRVEELKYSGNNGGHHRKLVDDNEEKLAVALAKLERVRLKHDRQEKILIGVKSGIEHLADKMEAIRDDGKKLQVTDDSIVEVLHYCEQTLVGILNQLGNKVESLLKEPSESVDPRDMDVFDSDIIHCRPYNQRISLPGEGSGVEDIELEAEILVEDNDEALSRDKVKKAATQVVQTQEKKKKKQAKNKEGNESPSAKSPNKR